MILFDDFSEENITVQIEAVYHEGKFFYRDDIKKEVELKDSAYVKIRTYLTDILEKDIDRYKLVREKVLPKDTILRFDLPKTGLTFYVKLLEDLVFRKIHNKMAIAENCKCEVTHATTSSAPSTAIVPKFQSFEVETLNQAFFRTSVMFRENARSHTTNIYKAFKYLKNGHFIPLEELRF